MAAIQFSSDLDVQSGRIVNATEDELRATVQVLGETNIRNSGTLETSYIFKFLNDLHIRTGGLLHVNHGFVINEGILYNEGTIDAYDEFSALFEGAEHFEDIRVVRIVNEEEGLIALYDDVVLAGVETLVNRGRIVSYGDRNGIQFFFENEGIVEVMSDLLFIPRSRAVEPTPGTYVVNAGSTLSIGADSLGAATIEGDGGVGVEGYREEDPVVIDGTIDITGNVAFNNFLLQDVAVTDDIQGKLTFKGKGELILDEDFFFPYLQIEGEISTTSAIVADSLLLIGGLVDCNNGTTRGLDWVRIRDDALIGQTCSVHIPGTGFIDDVRPVGGIVIDSSGVATSTGGFFGNGFLQVRPGATYYHDARVERNVSIINSGLMIIAAHSGELEGYLDNTGTVVFQASGQEEAHLTISGELIQESPGKIIGTGTLKLNAEYIDFGGVVAPGGTERSEAAGTIEMQEDFAPSEQARVELDMYDQLNIDGTLRPAGDLVINDMVEEENGVFTCLPEPGSSWNLMTYSDTTGIFYNVQAPKFFKSTGVEDRRVSSLEITDSALTAHISVENGKPVANTDSYFLSADTSQVIFPLLNDGDPDNDELRIVELIPHGRTEILFDINLDNPCLGRIDNLRLVRPTNFSAVDSMKYVVADRYGLRDTSVVYMEYVDDLPIAPVASASEIYPNPGSGASPFRVRVTTEDENDVTIDMFDALGRRVSSSTFPSLSPGTIHELSLGNLNSLAAGIYYVRIREIGVPKPLTRKFVKL